jgi:alpha-1,2-mannosyltransferase
MDVAYHFQYTEIPNILIEAGYKPIPPPPGYEKKQMEQGYNPEWDFTVLKDFDPTIKLCYGKEWFRYPGSYLIPEGIEVDWIKGEFDGMMPMKWQKSLPSKSMWKREQTRTIIGGRFNNQNEENMNAYVSLAMVFCIITLRIPILTAFVRTCQVNASECTYIIDSSMPSADPTVLQPDYAADVENWDRLFCTPFLDASLTPWWARVIYLPGKKAEEARVWGEYCLLRNRNA